MKKSDILNSKLFEMERMGSGGTEEYYKIYKKWIEERSKDWANRPKPNYYSDTKLIDNHFKEIKRRYSSATISHHGDHPDCTSWIEIPDFQFGEYYNRNIGRLAILVPTGYPFACPADFYIDPNLTLKHGGSISYTAIGQSYYGSKWWNRILIRVNQWSPNRDTVYNYLMTVKHRISKGF